MLWIPIRIIIWAVREDGRGLFSGTNAALRPGQVFGAFVIAAAFAMLGGLLGARSLRRSALKRQLSWVTARWLATLCRSAGMTGRANMATVR